jgi:DNA-binding protein H-NS
MNDLTRILGAERHEDENEAEEEESQRLEQLEELLTTFEHSEISTEECTQVPLEDSLLRLLAQHRSFRICRRTIF